MAPAGRNSELRPAGLPTRDAEPDVTFFQEQPYQLPRTLAPELVAYHRQTLALHANKPETGSCALCGVPGCPDWCAAFDQLAVAGELMAEPGQWQGQVSD